MRVALMIGGLIGLLALAAPASAATVVVYANPETLERHMVVVDPKGPDRIYLCMLPPAEAGCQRVHARRR
ncbi:MAG TPA: hypothetical protein VFK58_04955 [Sphingomicrobium sp.]|nr:hypothetical protein [Sphingomicrobium sp.]